MGSTSTSARAQLNRHVREARMRHGKAKAHARRQAHQQLHQAMVAASRPAQTNEDCGIMALILRPIRRQKTDTMFSDCRLHLISALGLRTCRIHRVQGYDLQNPPSKFQGVRLDSVQAHQCCTLALHRMLLPKAVAAFQEDLSLRFVLIAENDARITAALEKHARGAAALRQALGRASRTTSVWCGYNRANSWPIWGAHALAVSRSSCSILLARTEWEYQNAGYYALDTYYSCLRWQGEVEISHTKVFRQRRHKLTG